MDDIKKRAEQYAHSYPFAKVADAYEAGALAERELIRDSITAMEVEAINRSRGVDFQSFEIKHKTDGNEKV